MRPRILDGRRGFTLVEMAVVIAILGVLAAVAAALLVNYLGGAKERAYETDLRIVQESVDAFFSAPNNFRFQGKNQYPIIGRGETDRTGHTVRTASFDHPDDGTPLAATERDAVAGADNPDWNPLAGTQGADLLKAGATPTYKIAWTDDGDGVREILVATSETTRSPDTWTTIQVTREGVTYYVDPRYYFVDMDALVSARLLREVPKSSSLDNSATGTGSFTYYVDDKGKVQTLPFDFPRTNGFQKVAPTPTPTPPGTWTTKAPMPTARYGHDVGVVNGILYAVGGNLNGTILSKVEAYDSATNTWTTKAPMPTARYGLAVGVINGSLYAVGGCADNDCSSFLSTVEAYDPVTNNWTTKAPMLQARRFIAAAVVNGILYVMGGLPGPGQNILASVEAYDPVTDKWVTKTPMPTPRNGYAAASVNGLVYVVGGIIACCAPLQIGEFIAFDPATNIWTTKTQMPTPRFGLAVGVVNGILYAVGGTSTSGVVGGTEAYDPTANSWDTKAPMLTGRASLAAGVANGILYAVGGSNVSGIVATNEAFTPAPP